MVITSGEKTLLESTAMKAEMVKGQVKITWIQEVRGLSHTVELWCSAPDVLQLLVALSQGLQLQLTPKSPITLARG